MLEDHRVLFVGYDVIHPQKSMIRFVVHTSSMATPRQCIQDAITTIREHLHNMIENIEAI